MSDVYNQPTAPLTERTAAPSRGAAPPPRDTADRREPSTLADIVAGEQHTLERGFYRGGLYTSLGGMLLSLAAGAGLLFGDDVGTLLAWAPFAMAAVSAAAYGAAASLTSGFSGRPGLALAVRGFAGGATVVFPWALPLYMVAATGFVTALSTWLPVQIATAALVLSMLTLRPAVPLALGGANAAAYLLVFFFVVRPAAPPELAGEFMLEPRVHVFRAVTLLLTGVACAMGVRGIKRILRRGERAVRQRDLLGKYRLGDRLGEGGMGVVHRGTYCPEGGFVRAVAMKMIRPALAERPDIVDAFRREAELCASLQHPNIVQVLDFGRVEGTYFLAMEYVDGLDLGDVIDRLRARGDQLPLAVVIDVALQLAEGLHFAHAVARTADGELLRVVHRDLTPRNVMLTRAGQVKLTDFGIARVLKDADAAQTASITGKAAYMAPEQIKAEPFDERLDVFALGCVLWELLTLKPLYKRSTAEATLRAVLDGDRPSLSAVRSDVPASLVAVINRCLEGDPSLRYRSTAEVIDDLRAVEVVASDQDLRAVLRSLDGKGGPLDGDPTRSEPDLTSTAVLDGPAETTDAR